MKTLVLSGGGIKGIAILGLLQKLYKQGDLTNINKFIGTSVGSIICLLLSFGFTPLEIYSMTNKLNLNFLPYTTIISDYGFIDTSTVSNILKTEIKTKIGHIPTLLEHYKMTSKHYISVTTNLTKNRAEYIDYITFPDMNCITACEMSFSVPFIFKCIRYNGDIFVDGGLLDNFAIDYQFNNEERIGICLDCDYEIDSIMNFATKILDTAFQLKSEKKIEDIKDKCIIYKIYVDQFTTSKKKLFKKGCKTIPIK